MWLAESAGAAGFSKRVVIKTLRPELTADPRLVRQFVDEGQLLEQLDHPNIAQILDLGREDETWFLAMEYVEGFDLRALVRARASRNIGEIPTLCVLAAATRALAHAASRRGSDGKPLGIVHHDVTPSNLMVRRDGHVKLVDFGVARSAMRAQLDPGALRGKLPYLAPEQVRAPDAVDARVDLFGLGLIAFELLSGERALEVADPRGLEAAWQSLPARVSGLAAPGPTHAIVSRLCALDAERRPADATAASELVRARLSALGVADTESPLADALSDAFDRLEAEASGFNKTLSALLATEATDDPHTGTVSLPGLLPLGRSAPDATALQPASAAPALATPGSGPRDGGPGGGPTGVGSAGSAEATAPGPSAQGTDPPPADEARSEAGRRRSPPGTKRLRTALVLALLVAGGVGWWFGNRADRGARGPASSTTAVTTQDPVGPSAAARGESPAAASPGLIGAGVADVTAVAAGGGTPAVGEAPGMGMASDAGAGTASDAGPGAGSDVAPAAATPARDAAAETRAGPPDAVAPDPADTAEDTNTQSGAPDARRRPTPRDAARRRGTPRPSRRAASPAVGTLTFRVLPVDADVRVDGRPVPRARDGVYRLRLPAGRHAVEVRDRHSGRAVRRNERVERGRERKVPGFKLLGLP